MRYKKKKPLVSIIITASGKHRNQESNLWSMIHALSHQKFRDFEVLIVEQLMENRYIHDNHQIEGIDCRHIKLHRQQSRYYNLDWNRNAGAVESRGRKLVFADCDLVFDEDYVKSVADFDELYFIAWNQLYYLNKQESDSIRQGQRVKHHTKVTKPGCGCGITGDAGKSICLDRDFFFNQVGGFNESISGWGGDDNEMACRAIHLTKKFKSMPQKIYHLEHPRGNGTGHDQNHTHNIWRIGQSHPSEVTKRIKKAGIGKPEGPTLIKLDDLGWKL